MNLSPAAVKELNKVKVKPAKREEKGRRTDGRPPLDIGAVLKAAAVALGLNPTDTRYFSWYISDMENEHVKSCTCIRCGRVGLKRRSISVTDPVQMLRNLTELHGKIRPVLAILKRRGRIERKASRSVVLYNGFCSICVEVMDQNMPSAFRFDAPGENDFEILKGLIVDCARLGITKETIMVLEEIVREHTFPDTEDTEDDEI